MTPRSAEQAAQIRGLIKKEKERQAALDSEVQRREQEKQWAEVDKLRASTLKRLGVAASSGNGRMSR